LNTLEKQQQQTFVRPFESRERRNGAISGFRGRSTKEWFLGDEAGKT
jgi:hypothetical protein